MEEAYEEAQKFIISEWELRLIKKETSIIEFPLKGKEKREIRNESQQNEYRE